MDAVESLAKCRGTPSHRGGVSEQPRGNEIGQFFHVLSTHTPAHDFGGPKAQASHATTARQSNSAGEDVGVA